MMETSNGTDVLRREFYSTKFARFLLAGGIAAVVNIGSRIALSGVMAYVPAIVAAYLFGLTTAYVLNRAMVFGRGDRSVMAEVAVFAAVNVLAIAQTLAVSLALAYYALPAMGVVRFDETIAHVVGVIVPVFTSFLGHKYWSFRGHWK